MRKSVLLILPLLAGCGREEPVAQPTAEESRQLNEAEAMLNGMDEKGLDAEASSPSNRTD